MYENTGVRYAASSARSSAQPSLSSQELMGPEKHNWGSDSIFPTTPPLPSRLPPGPCLTAFQSTVRTTLRPSAPIFRFLLFTLAFPSTPLQRQPSSSATIVNPRQTVEPTLISFATSRPLRTGRRTSGRAVHRSWNAFLVMIWSTSSNYTQP